MDGSFKSDEELEEDMKDELDSVMGLLDRLKEDRQQELMSSQSDKLSRLEKLKRSRVREMQGVRAGHKEDQASHYTTQGLGSQDREHAIDVKLKLTADQMQENRYREGQQKRKQETIVAELREKAEIISKSARKGPEDIAGTLSRTRDIEADPEAAEYLRMIRETTAKTEPEEKKEKTLERSTVTIDFPSPTMPKASVTVKLNLDMQKSKIAVAKGSGLQGRRKPTSEHIRRSLKLSDDEEPDDVLGGYEAGREDMDEDDSISPVEATSVEASALSSEESSDPMAAGRAEAKIMPPSPVAYGHQVNMDRRGSFEGLIPRTTPKPRKPSWKSKTYGGVALPAFAEAMKAGSKSLKKTNTAERLTVDIVKQAAIDKLNRAAKEDKPDIEPEKPAWLVEAETRRKLHDRRRSQGNKVKPPPEAESPGSFSVRLKATGLKLQEDESEKKVSPESEEQEDTKKNQFVVKLKSSSTQGDRRQFEPEETKISFKLKSTGIQLVEPEQPEQPVILAQPVYRDRQEPVRPVIPAQPVNRSRQEQVIPAQVLNFEAQPRHEGVRGDKQDISAAPAKPVRLRPVETTPGRKVIQEKQESELAIRLRQRGKAPPTHPDEDDTENLNHRVPRQGDQREEPEVVTQTLTSYVTPKPVKVVSQSDFKTVTIGRKPLESAKLINQTTRTTAESTPFSFSTARPATKPSYKVTPLSSEPPRLNRGFNPVQSTRVYESPMSPSSSRSFSPPTFPTSKVTVVSHHVETPPNRSTSAQKITRGRRLSAEPDSYISPSPLKTTRGRRLSSERAKTVVVHGGDVPRIVPGRRLSSEKSVVSRTSSLEYPKSHVEKASEGHLKHAVTVTKSTTMPKKAQTLEAGSAYRPQWTGEVLPPWKQTLMERKRSSSGTREQEMMERHKSNKENEPRSATGEPHWMKEVAEKKSIVFNRKMSNGDPQYERIEAFDKFEKPAKQPEDSDEEVREVPSFMKEFERKRRMKGKGSERSESSYPSSSSSYV